MSRATESTFYNLINFFSITCVLFHRELKNEINQLRQQSAIKVGEEQKSRQCQRCHAELGLIFSRGELCPKCKHLICSNCRTDVQNSTTYQWLCSLCYKQRYAGLSVQRFGDKQHQFHVEIISHTMEHCMTFKMLGFIIIIILTPLFKLRSREN